MKHKKKILLPPEFSADYGSKNDWDEIISIAQRQGKKLDVDRAQAVVYFLRKLAKIVVEQFDNYSVIKK
jgi:selenocysteine lyase/cysteine desulfurase